MRGLLKNRHFLPLWLGQSLSEAGNWLRHMALTYWVYQTSGHSPTATAGMVVATYAPFLLGPIAGVLVNRWSRRKTMLWTQLLCAGCSAVLVLAFRGHSRLLVYAIAFLSSAISQFYNPARQATIPAIVERDQLVQANSLSQTTSYLAVVLGPMLGTAIYFSIGPSWSLAADALSFLAVAGAIIIADLPDGRAGEAVTAIDLTGDLREGFSYLWTNKLVRYSTFCISLASFGGGAVNVCELFLLTRNLGLPESRLSPLLSVFGIATVGASLCISSLSKRLSSTWPLVAAGLGILGVAVLGEALAPSFLWMLFWNVFCGVGQAAESIGATSLIQDKVEQGFLTRVFGVTQPSAVTASLLGSWLGGILANLIDVRLVMGGSAVIMLAAALLAHLFLSQERTTVGPPIGTLPSPSD